MSPNTWNLPGGGIEEGETYQQALLRELQEEIGITPGNTTYLGKQQYEDGNIVHRFLVKITMQEFKVIKLGNEGQKYHFFQLKEMGNIHIAKHSKEYFEKYTNQLKQLIEKDQPIKKLQ